MNVILRLRANLWVTNTVKEKTTSHNLFCSQNSILFTFLHLCSGISCPACPRCFLSIPHCKAPPQLGTFQASIVPLLSIHDLFRWKALLFHSIFHSRKAVCIFFYLLRKFLNRQCYFFVLLFHLFYLLIQVLTRFFLSVAFLQRFIQHSTFLRLP